MAHDLPSCLPPSALARGFAFSVSRHRSCQLLSISQISHPLLFLPPSFSCSALTKSICSSVHGTPSLHLFTATSSLPYLIMAPSSVASDDSGNDVIQRHLSCAFLTNSLRQDGFIVDIDTIQAHGIGAVDIAKLKANGYYTIASVHSATRRNLLKIKGFSEIKVDKVKDAITKCQVQCLSTLHRQA